MSSEEEMHMLPSFCEGIPSDMSPSEWCLVLFPTLPAELSQEIGDRGSNGEKEMLRHFFWRSRFNWRKGDVAAFSGVQMEIGVEDYIRDEVLRIIFCSCVALDSFGWPMEVVIGVFQGRDTHVTFLL